ncbi:MAG: peptidase, partial [Bradyrhizobium sp.]
VCGGALPLRRPLFRQGPWPSGRAGQAGLARLHAKESGIPYGIALTLGALTVYPETEWVKAIDLAHLALR